MKSGKTQKTQKHRKIGITLKSRSNNFSGGSGEGERLLGGSRRPVRGRGWRGG